MRRTFLAAATAACTSCLMLTGAAATAVSPAAITHSPRIKAAQVHASSGWSSSNWSGYAKSGSYTAATATWVVPAVTATRSASYSSAWVGIDGFTNSSLIQTGTESDWYNGKAHYNAWWEILPAAETPISSFAVHPGDVMSASIANNGDGTWTITISDSKGGSFSTRQTYSGPGTSVEWIEEAPTVGGRVATLAHYGSPDLFDPGTANGKSPGLTAADAGVMVQKRAQVSTPSAPDGDGDGFNVSYGATAPAAPTS